MLRRYLIKIQPLKVITLNFNEKPNKLNKILFPTAKDGMI